MIYVMIVEDDPMVREINSKYVNKLNDFKLINGVANLNDAIECISNNNIDLVLLDIYLPKENGMDFLKWLRNKEHDVDVILITADNTSDMIQEAFRYGAVDYLIKPFTFTRFSEALNNYKARYYSFNKLKVIEQNSLDKHIKNTLIGDKEDQEDEYEKGVNKYTYKIIWNIVEKYPHDYKTSEEISKESGVARVTVRRYLEYMEKEGKVEKSIEYGKIGRPQHKYKKII